jgi:hypothetical protein
MNSHLSYRRVERVPLARVKPGVAYRRGSAAGGRLLVKAFGLAYLP